MAWELIEWDMMSVIFILIGLAYAIYYVKKMFDLKKKEDPFDAGKDVEKEEKCFASE